MLVCWYGRPEAQKQGQEDGAVAVSVIDRLADAINKHDIEMLTACFAPSFANDWPAHPARSFTGADQVRRNWEAIFQSYPTVKAKIVRRVHSGDETWAEWEFTSEIRDGAEFWQRGVIVVETDEDRIVKASFYMEPVETAQETPGS
jgi:ketosteroid isomerase-like protein